MVGGAFPDWHRDVDQFEQVMGYYWVTTAQEYLQHLGFGSTLRPVNQRQIELRINQFGGDNSFFRDDKANITIGKGGVDDGEDAEVIVHEYGHSVQDGQVPGFGTNAESGAIGEAFSDYLAVVVTSWKAGVPTLTPEACVADWDSVSYTSTTPHCLRRIDGNKHYPEDSRTRCTATARSGHARCGTSARVLGDTKASTADRRGPVRLRGRHELRRRRHRDRGCRAAPLRDGRGERRHGTLAEPRHPRTSPPEPPATG